MKKIIDTLTWEGKKSASDFHLIILVLMIFPISWAFNSLFNSLNYGEVLFSLIKIIIAVGIFIFILKKYDIKGYLVKETKGIK